MPPAIKITVTPKCNVNDMICFIAAECFQVSTIVPYSHGMEASLSFIFTYFIFIRFAYHNKNLALKLNTVL